jgi:rare lipoprotein A
MDAHAAMRDRRAARTAMGALIVALPASAALTPAEALAQAIATPSPPAGAVPFLLRASQFEYGDRVLVTGIAPSAPTAQTLELQFESTRTSSWKTLATTSPAGGSRFELSARLTMSGTLRVVDAMAPGSGIPQAGTASSTIRRVLVTAAMKVYQRRIDVLAGTRVGLHGRLLPGLRGRLVRLQARSGGRWHTVANGRTTARGAFTISYVPRALGVQRLRVRFSGDRLNARISTRDGTLTVFRQAFASWYYDRGATGCGFNAFYGVANRTLPCGTSVQIRLGSRTVTAVVDDRGPYVGGREWDLGQNTAAALGFVGVGTVWSTR